MPGRNLVPGTEGKLGVGGVRCVWHGFLGMGILADQGPDAASTGTEWAGTGAEAVGK